MGINNFECHHPIYMGDHGTHSFWLLVSDAATVCRPQLVWWAELAGGVGSGYAGSDPSNQWSEPRSLFTFCWHSIYFYCRLQFTQYCSWLSSTYRFSFYHGSTCYLCVCCSSSLWYSARRTVGLP